MNKTETVLLCRYAKAMCPAQAIDEYTPDAWADVLDDVTLDEAKAAIVDGVRNRGWRFIDVTDVVAGARASRKSKLEDWSRQFGALVPPYALGGDPEAEREWLLNARRRILDGEVTHPSQLGPQPDLRPDDVAALGLAGRPVPSPNYAQQAEATRAKLREHRPAPDVTPNPAADTRAALHTSEEPA